MSDYIEREAALSAQNKSMNLSECRKRLERIPAADVRHVRRGKWIDDGSGCVVCSECGEEHEWYTFRANFCDNCGADMREVLGDE